MGDLTYLESDRVLQHIRNVAKEHLNMTDEQLARLDPDAPILSEVPLDSLSQVVLATSIESDFRLTLEPEDWQSVVTIRDLIKLVHWVQPLDGVARFGGIDEVIAKEESTFAGFGQALRQMLRTLDTEMPVDDRKDKKILPAIDRFPLDQRRQIGG